DLSVPRHHVRPALLGRTHSLAAVSRARRSQDFRRRPRSDSAHGRSARSSACSDRGLGSSTEGQQIVMAKKKASAAGPKAEQKRAAEARERAGQQHTSHERSTFLRGARIDPSPITGQETAADLIDNAFLAYNAARLREVCALFTQKMLEP